jgi:hypothetical protein
MQIICTATSTSDMPHLATSSPLLQDKCRHPPHHHKHTYSCTPHHHKHTYSCTAEELRSRFCPAPASCNKARAATKPSHPKPIRSPFVWHSLNATPGKGLRFAAPDRPHSKPTPVQSHRHLGNPDTSMHAPFVMST